MDWANLKKSFWCKFGAPKWLYRTFMTLLLWIEPIWTKFVLYRTTDSWKKSFFQESVTALISANFASLKNLRIRAPSFVHKLLIIKKNYTNFATSQILSLWRGHEGGLIAYSCVGISLIHKFPFWYFMGRIRRDYIYFLKSDKNRGSYSPSKGAKFRAKVPEFLLSCGIVLLFWLLNPYYNII